MTALGSARPLVSFDGGNPAEGLDLGVIDLYVPTVRALADRYGTGDAAALVGAALAEGAPAVVATAGAEGAWLGGSIVDRGRAAEPAAAPAVRHVPALPVDAVSTLGAGDVFHGALLAGVVQGKPLVEAVAAANICAGRSCRAMDGRSGIPDAAELDTLMAIHADALVGREDD